MECDAVVSSSDEEGNPGEGPSNVNRGKCSNPDSNIDRKISVKENARENRKRKGKFGGKKLVFRDGKRVKSVKSKVSVENLSDSIGSSQDCEESDIQQQQSEHVDYHHQLENISDSEEGINTNKHFFP